MVTIKSAYLFTKRRYTICLLLTCFLFCSFLRTYSQEPSYKEYSYSEFFQLIENEKDSVFELRNALIRFDEQTDTHFEQNENVLDSKSRTRDFSSNIRINKHLVLNNVQFVPKILGQKGLIRNITFNKSVTLNETVSAIFVDCLFQEHFVFTISNSNQKAQEALRYKRNLQSIVINNEFRNGLDVNIYSQRGEDLDFSYFFISNHVKTKSSSTFKQKSLLRARFIDSYYAHDNFFNSPIWMISDGNKSIDIAKNHFQGIGSKLSFYDLKKSTDFFLIENKFEEPIFLDMKEFKSSFTIDYDQFNQKLISSYAYDLTMISDSTYSSQNPYSSEMISKYLNETRYIHKDAFKGEVALRGQFYKLYKDKMDSEYSNEVYVEIKELETNRTKIEHTQNPSFNTFFKWRISQFLKIFSNYGTEPERSIIFSMYVIIFFSIIYLFFPNTWDVHGKKRIIDRYTFFFTYMNNKAGMHEVYLESKKDDILEFKDFKTLLEKQGKTVPKFFTATAYPLYKWSISGTKLSASLLKRFDVMRGTWEELPKKKKVWKSFLLISVFILAICYDLIIKILNALMLSINTFTTLGFGDIPIKGFPRYLAIIQGFIGWFMLTIFSVALISQLLD